MLPIHEGPGERDRAIIREIGGGASGLGTDVEGKKGVTLERWVNLFIMGVIWNYWWVAYA